MSGHILFSVFHKENLIDKLLGELKENFKWEIDEIDSDFHRYHWCNIILTEERKIIPIKDVTIELLGEYSNKKQEIKLYIRMIEYYGKEEFKMDSEKSKNLIEKLTYIVLIHEMAHWIVYAIKDSKKNIIIGTRDNEDDSTNFHEGLAQYFTWYIIKNDSELLRIFEKLNENQPNQYKVFKDLITRDISDIIIAISVSRKLNRQSWEFLKLVIEISEFLKKDEIDYFNRLDIMINPNNHKSDLLKDEDAKMILKKFKTDDINLDFCKQFFSSKFMDENRGKFASKKYGF